MASPFPSVALDLIDEDPENPRGEVGDVSDLKQSISRLGQQDPIHVIRQANGRYFVHEGHRRLKALRELGETTARAIERHFSTKRAQVLSQGTLHAHRRNFNPMAWSRYLHRLYWQYDMTRDAIATELGVSPAWVRDTLSFVHLSETQQRELESGAMTRTEALRILADRRALRDRRERRSAATTQTAIPAQRGPRTSYFSGGHALAEQAAARCASGGLEHAAAPKMGGIACGPCWENTIRADALTAARPVLSAA